jgi:hypothetical protein
MRGVRSDGPRGVEEGTLPPDSIHGPVQTVGGAQHEAAA